VHNSKLKRISLAVCFALMPMAANAAGLGKLTVISGLGEPLNAEVELSANKDELSSITAQIASAEAFEEQGIERASALSGVRVEVGTRPDGVPVLRLKSAQAISDPFLDMLIQVEWSSGRLLREYTALLDPPGYGSNQATTATAAVTVPASTSMPGAASDKMVATGKSKSRKTTASEAEPAPEGEITVQKGDTLHAIAMANQVEGVSLEQMLVGLYRANKDAFAGSNMNRLKVGQIIRVPPQEELQAVTRQEAVKEIRVQTADWNAYRNKLAGMVAEAAPAQESQSAQTASGKITAPAQDTSAPAPTGPRDVVKLSKSEAGDVKGRITALQEEATAREKSIKESNERVALLEKQLQDVKKLAEIKNKALADAQDAGKTPPPPPPVVAPEPKPAEQPAKVEPPKVATPPVAEKKPEAAMPPVAEAPAQEKTPEPVKPPKKKKIIHPAPPPPPEPGMFDDLLSNPLLPIGGGGLLALIGGAWFYMRNKRRKGLDSFEQGILTTGGLKPNTVFGNTAGGTVDTGNTSFLTDFGQGAAAGMIDTNDVDPIAEAEVYMAYGRDAQAEEILKDAIAKEPKRHELHLKLLEIFAGRKDTGAFETLAGELYAALGATDPTWAKVAEMGRKLEPNNPLYGDTGTHAAEAKPEPVDFDATMIQTPPTGDEALGALDIGLGGPDTTLDFSLDEPVAPAVSATEQQEESNALDFDLGGLEMPGAEAAASAESEMPGLDDVAELDFPLMSEETPAVEEAAAEAESAGLDFDMELPEAPVESNVQLDVADLGVNEVPSLEAAAPVEEAAALSLDLPELGSLEAPVAEALELPPEEPIEASVADLAMPEPEQPALAEAAPEAEALDLDLDIGAETVAEQAADDISLDLDFPALDTAEPAVTTAKAEPAQEFPAEEVAAEEISLDLPDVDDGMGLDIDFDEPVDAPAVKAVEADETVVLEAPSAEVGVVEEPKAITDSVVDLDFNFDVDLGESEAVIAEPVAASVPALDLSDISLDLGGADATAPAEEITLGETNESPDVDTKLDLVTAYIDMGDQEGARELLEEILQEGGPAQRSKAQKLMADLG
jgi:pilus assembly protein FimV